MAGRGPAPKKNAQRRNKGDRWSPSEWGDLVDGEGVPELPPGEWGRQAEELWDALWTGPLRAEFLPQQMVELETLLELVESKRRLEPDDVRGLIALSGEIRLLGGAFGLTPEAVRRLRIEVKRPKSGSGDDELSAAREARRKELRARAAK